MLKDTWVDKKDGVDINSADDINQVAHAVIDLEKEAENKDETGIHIGPEAPTNGEQIWIDTDEEGAEDGGTSIDVTAEVGQTIIVKEVDANGKPTKWEAAEYQPRTHWKTETVILPETTVEVDPEAGMGLIPAEFTLENGKAYTVKYNGVEYVSTCSANEEGVFFGNLGPVSEGTMPDTGEPFYAGYGAIAEDDSGNPIYGWGIAPLDGSTSVTLSIAEIVCHTIPSEYLPKQQYIFEVPMESFRYDDAEKDYRLILSEIPLELLEAMYLRMPIYLKVIDIYNGEIYIEYIASAQYSGAIELAWVLADKTLEMIPITDIFNACSIRLSAHIAKTSNHFNPFHIPFVSEE